MIIKNGKAIVHPIAGTFKRTGDDETDKQEAERLLLDAKENAEHVMLVDLARNDLSRLCDDVKVDALPRSTILQSCYSPRERGNGQGSAWNTILLSYWQKHSRPEH